MVGWEGLTVWWPGSFEVHCRQVPVPSQLHQRSHNLTRQQLPICLRRLSWGPLPNSSPMLDAVRRFPSRWASATWTRADAVKWVRRQSREPTYTMHVCSIYLWPICEITRRRLHGSAGFPHSAVLTEFDQTNVEASLLSSLGSCGTNSPELCRLVMTPDQLRQAGLIVLIRCSIGGN